MGRVGKMAASLLPVCRQFVVPRLQPASIHSLRSSSSSTVFGSSDAPYSNNDIVAPRLQNRNPMNLERMRIGRKPEGFQLEKDTRKYWNKLTLEISNRHTTATVTHWTGRQVAKASTTEWPIRKQLYNATDNAAVQAVAKIISQRCLETGVYEMHLLVDKEELSKEKMKKFVSIIEECGLSLLESEVYEPENPHRDDYYNIKPATVQPWTARTINQNIYNIHI